MITIFHPSCRYTDIRFNSTCFEWFNDPQGTAVSSAASAAAAAAAIELDHTVTNTRPATKQRLFSKLSVDHALNSAQFVLLNALCDDNKLPELYDLLNIVQCYKN